MLSFNEIEQHLLVSVLKYDEIEGRSRIHQDIGCIGMIVLGAHIVIILTQQPSD